MSSSTHYKHQYPGAFLYKGVTYLPYTTLEYLMKIEDEMFPFGKDAVFVTSYPKTGWCATQLYRLLFIWG